MWLVTATPIKNNFSGIVEFFKVMGVWTYLQQFIPKNISPKEFLKRIDNFCTTKDSVKIEDVKKLLEKMIPEIKKMVFFDDSANIEKIMYKKTQKKVYKYVIIPNLSERQENAIKFIDVVLQFQSKMIVPLIQTIDENGKVTKKRMVILNYLHYHQLCEQILFSMYDGLYAWFSSVFKHLKKNYDTIPW